MNALRTHLLIICILLSYSSYSQNGDPLTLSQSEINFEAFIEDIFSIQEEDVNYEDLYETLLQLYLHPIDINLATRQELQSLYILSELQINEILVHREEFGAFLSLYELQAIPSFDIVTIQKLLPFITLSEGAMILPGQLIYNENNFFFLRHERTLQEKRGYTPADSNSRGEVNQRYLGSPDKVYARMKVHNPGSFTAGFTLEKDPGEQLIWDPNTSRYGFDFWSGHCLLQNKGNFKNIIIGDYQLQFGQGVLLGAGFNIGKGAETVTTVRRGNLGIRPYTSVMETGFFRGAATTYELQNLELTAFYSNRNIDGKKEDLESQEDYFTSIYTSGLHRTPNEIAAKGAINEEVKGLVGILKSDDRRFNIGGGYIQTGYDVPLQRIERIYNQYEFSGNSNETFNIFFNYYWKNFNFFGETARSSNKGSGTVAGFISSLSSKVEMSFLFRNYTRDFHSFYGNPFRENSRPINETGTYWGLKYTPSGKLFFSAYYDKFYFPWLKYQVNAPSNGHEFLIRSNYRPSKKVLLYVQFREKEKAINYNDGTDVFVPVLQGIKRNVLLNLDFQSSERITLKSRIQFSSYTIGKSTTKGLAMIQDFNYDLRRFRFSSRIALFDTDDYVNRQYVYERNVLYAFSLPAYYGRGVRGYILAQYTVNRNITLWMRYSNSNFRDRDSIGSGLEIIEGNNRTELTSQIRIKF